MPKSRGIPLSPINDTATRASPAGWGGAEHRTRELDTNVAGPAGLRPHWQTSSEVGRIGTKLVPWTRMMSAPPETGPYRGSSREMMGESSGV